MAEPKRKQNFNPDLKIFENADGYDNLNRKTSNEEEIDTSQQEEKSTKDEQKDENSKYIIESVKIYKEFANFMNNILNLYNKDREIIKIILENKDKRAIELYHITRINLRKSDTENERKQTLSFYKEEIEKLRKDAIEEIKNLNLDKGIGIGLVIGIFIGTTMGIGTGIAICKKFNKQQKSN